jgi:hypothetical protein
MKYLIGFLKRLAIVVGFPLLLVAAFVGMMLAFVASITLILLNPVWYILTGNNKLFQLGEQIMEVIP